MPVGIVHKERHPQAGMKVTHQSKEYVIYDWLDRVIDGDWRLMKDGNRLADSYHRRRGRMGKGAPPKDMDVVVLHGDTSLRAVHISEFELVSEGDQG